MQKNPTRRAKEYFEILDELRQEGFLTHEEWRLLPPNEQLSRSKMTNRIIEDALIDHGYSKGSPNELKKYRELWILERDIVLSVDHADIKFDITSDPILSAVDHFRKKIVSEAEEKTHQEILKLKNELEIVKSQYFEKCDIFQEVSDKYSQVQHLSEDLQSQCGMLQKQLENELKMRELAEKRFNDADNSYNQLLNVNHHMLSDLSEHDEQLSHLFDQNLSKIQEQFNTQLNDFINNFEKQQQESLFMIEKLFEEKQSLAVQLECTTKECESHKSRIVHYQEELSRYKNHENELKILENVNKKLENENYFVKVETIHLKALLEDYKNQRDNAYIQLKELINDLGG